MSEDKIPKYELDLLSTAINRIVSSEVLENSMSDQLPLTDDLSDSNKIYQPISKDLQELYSDSCSSDSIFRRSCTRFHGGWRSCSFCR